MTYHWVFSDGGTDSTGPHTLTYASASAQTITYEWTTTATGIWVGVYIDNPNHYQYQGPTMTCP